MHDFVTLLRVMTTSFVSTSYLTIFVILILTEAHAELMILKHYKTSMNI